MLLKFTAKWADTVIVEYIYVCWDTLLKFKLKYIIDIIQNAIDNFDSKLLKSLQN